ncbi:MAG: hypothetical protein Q4A29_07810 [Eubacteriales bacterium]|nr:hypothetical protein [Eubacteriales bacterium]
MLSKKEKSIWARGIVLSFDFVVEWLEEYYSETSPQGAYTVIKNYLLKHGFEHKKDTDYVHKEMDKIAAVRVLVQFSKEQKWFPFCIRKLNISPNVVSLDIAEEFRKLQDEKWGKKQTGGKSDEKEDDSGI